MQETEPEHSYRLQPQQGDNDGRVGTEQSVEGVWDKSVEAKRNQIEIINANFVQLVAGTVVGALVLVSFLWQSVPPGKLLLWMSVVWGLAFFRSLVFRRHRNVSLERREVERVAREMVVLAGLAGVAWGIGGVVFYQPGDFLVSVILTLVLGGMVSGCVATYAGHPPVFFAFSVPVVVPFVFEAMVFGHAGEWIPAFGLLFLFLVNVSYCLNFHKIIVESLELRFENQGLVRSLRTERDRVEAASIERSRFLAASSHDLRQPLHALGLLHATLEDRYGAVAPAVFERMREARASMLEMFNGFLDKTRIESGTVVVEEALFNLPDLLSDLTAEFKSSESGSKVVFERPKEPVFVKTDRVLFSRILRNLITNALKFSSNKPVDVTLDAADGRAVVVVSDQGPGIAREDLPKIFEDYTQLSGQQPRKRGIGLGLSIVREFSEKLDVGVTVRSRRGAGTRFLVEIKTMESPVIPEADDQQAPEHRDTLKGKVIAVLDDEIAVQEALVALLTGWGASVVAGATLAQLMTQLEKAPDVLVADFDLGEDQPNGVETNDILNEEFNTNIPMLLISGNLQALQDSLAASHSFRLDALAKPVERRDLWNRLTPLLTPSPTSF